MNDRYRNRELSWLDFNERVLALAEEESAPLLERVKFLAIFNRNLDEFFQVRVALIQAEHEAGLGANALDGHTPEALLAAIRTRVDGLIEREQALFNKELRPALAAAGIRLCDEDDLEREDLDFLSRYFDERIFPVLTPLAVDPAHPFPYVSNLSFNVAVLVRDPANDTVRFARIKIPDLLDRFIGLPDGERFVPIEQCIEAHLDRLFPGMEIASHSVFRVSRDAEIEIEEDEDDLLEAIESGLQRQRRLSDAVRLEVDARMSPRTRTMLLDELELDEQDVYVRTALLDLGALWDLYALDRADLKERPWRPRSSPAFAPPGEDTAADFFAVLRRGDVLVQHPYESFETSVEAFLRQAAADPDVLAIKHTIYRTAGPEDGNPIGRTVMKAAEMGKQVVSLVELKARFDEQANIEWARRLEQSGVHVVYGLVGLKTHAKIVLVVRKERDGIRRYCHIGTGNYNPVTARLYEDVGIFSADPELGADLSELFNHLTGFSHETTYSKLLVAPVHLRDELIARIREEMQHPDGRLIFKVNNLSDARLIDALYEASAAGVEIDLLVRSVCCLRAGVPGLSERIRVRSILGSFLEHSRIFRFGSEARGPRYFIGSADLMPRNLDRRVEVVTPVESPGLRARLEEILQLELADDRAAWRLADSTWVRVAGGRGLSAQHELQRRAKERARAASDLVG